MDAQTPTTALVVEGGGMRGAYAAGAIVELVQNQRRTYDAIWATSSGAASAAYAVTRQPEGITIWRDHLHGRRLVNPWRLLAARPALDLDYLVDEVFAKRVPLDVQALKRSGTPLIVPATDADDGRANYFDLRRGDPFPILKAAMALPGAIRKPIEIEGQPYVDGGVVDQVPIQKAIDAGATDITVVLTRPASYTPRPMGRLGLRLASGPFPGIRGALMTRHERYLRAMRTLKSPPAGVRVRVVRPRLEMPLKRWTRKRRLLLAAIQAGGEDAHQLASKALSAEGRLPTHA
jgi:predicted patatin/cPLA2 family phospholipase